VALYYLALDQYSTVDFDWVQSCQTLALQFLLQSLLVSCFIPHFLETLLVLNGLAELIFGHLHLLTDAKRAEAANTGVTLFVHGQLLESALVVSFPQDC